MNNRKHPFRLYELSLQAMENVISDDDFMELNEILRENPKAMELYFEFMSTCSSLYRELGETISEPCHRSPEEPNDMQSLWLALAEEERTAATVHIPKPKEEPPRLTVQLQEVAKPERKISKFSIFSVAVSLAAVLLLVAYVRLVPVPKPIVGVLTDSHNARWADTASSIAVGDHLQSGYMDLQSGFAEMTFDNGAKVIIEGPAQFELESEGEIFLQKGKISCVVPPRAIGFTVGTPAATVVDFGTEFGVVVQESGRTETHVFRGQVELRTGPDALVFDDSRRLGAGQGSTVDENENLLQRRFRARANEFIRNELIPYEIAVRKSNPFAYWRFDTSEKAVFQDILMNKFQPCELHGNIKIVPGPELGNSKTSGAVQLDGQNSYVYVPKAGERKEVGREMNRNYSYSFWVRPDVIRAQDLITITNSGAAQYRHIGLDNDGRFSFFTYYFKNQKRRSEFTGNAIFQPGQWYHVVVTGTWSKSMQSQVCLYVNGQKDAEKLVHSTYSPKFYGHFYIGSVPEEGKVEGIHSFDGTITEVVEYSRTLTPQEVREIYSSVQY